MGMCGVYKWRWCEQVAGMHRCAWVCASVRRLAWVWAGVQGYSLVSACVWDEFSEFLPENRVPTSADFNTYPIRIFSNEMEN